MKTERVVQFYACEHGVPGNCAFCGAMQRTENTESELAQLRAERKELVEALRELMLRCDGEEGVRADGSNIQTMRASALLEKLGALE
jgi:hypothetical protein